jgi:multidrug resistance efflux pump
MLELMVCSLFTLLPDYLYRRYVQGKRFGQEITFYSVWYELRYGITGCLMLTIALITLVFYYHPATQSVTFYYRTIPVLPEASGRVAEVFVPFSGDVEKGAPLFRLDDSRQKAALETANRRITEVEAAMILAKSEIATADGQLREAKGAYEQAVEELETKQELQRRNASTVSVREIERLQKVVETRDGAVKAAEANKQAVETKLTTLLPAQKSSAEAARAQAQVDLDKTVVYSGVSGRVEQFTLRVGDIVNPLMRPAGILIPKTTRDEKEQLTLTAGFGQIEAQVLKVGVIAEVSCLSKPWTIVPMVVTRVQDYIAAGQLRASDQLVDPIQTTRPGTITVFLDPLFEGGLDGITSGSSCVAFAYSNNHDELSKKGIGIGRWLFLHVVDAVALVHALILRAQVLVMPVKQLVLGGH